MYIRGGQKNEKLAKINEKFQDGQFLIEVTPLIQEQFSFFVFVWPFFANLVKRDLHAIYNINGMYQRQKKKKNLKDAQNSNLKQVLESVLVTGPKTGFRFWFWAP